VNRWLLLVMILLLPLRGLVGGAMAAEMVQSGAHAAAAAAAVHAPSHDCVEHAAPQPTASHADAAPHGDMQHENTQSADGSCATCASCQVCSAVALAFAQFPTLPAVFANAPLAAANARFASAEPLRAFKPPIS
jgi:hypothetical protein